MPQFDPTFFSPQLFWLLVSFVTLYVVMSFVAVPRIGAVLDERQKKIDDNLEKAAQMKAEAEAAVAAYEKALAESRAHATAVIKETSERLAKQSEQRHKELADKLAEQIKSGEARIAAAKETALANVREVATDVAGSVVSRLVGAAPDQAKVVSAVAAAMQESR